MNKYFFVALLLAVTVCLCAEQRVEALSCAPPKPVMEEMEQSSVVFKGKAIKIKKNGLAVFQVEEAWKGVHTPTIEIYDNGWDPYQEGTDYLVFGSEQKGELRRNLCGRTGPWSPSQEQAMSEIDIVSQKFNKEEATATAANTMDRSPMAAYLLTSISVAVLALIVLFIFLWRRKRRRAN